MKSKSKQCTPDPDYSGTSSDCDSYTQPPECFSGIPECSDTPSSCSSLDRRMYKELPVIPRDSGKIIKVDGLPDSLLYDVYRVNSNLELTDCDIENVTTNNPAVIVITKGKVKRCFQKSTTKYCISLVSVGNGCLKIRMKNGTRRLFGIFVMDRKSHRKDNKSKAKKNCCKDNCCRDNCCDNKVITRYEAVKLGSVSDGSVNPDYTTRFWEDFDCINKRADMLYLQCKSSDVCTRKISYFLKNTLRLGQEACLIYNNNLTLQDLNDPCFMKNYFSSFIALLDIVKANITKTKIIILLESGIFNIINQENPLCIKVDLSLVDFCRFELLKEIRTHNNFKSFIRTLNRVLFLYCPIAKFGHVFSIEGSGIFMNITRSQGLGPGLKSLKRAAIRISNFYKDCGVLDFGPTYIAFNKHILDGGLIRGVDKLMDNNYFFNNDLWLNYLYFIRIFGDNLNLKKIIYQIPAGYLNRSLDISPYTRKRYPELPDQIQSAEDSSIVFFLGGVYTRQDAGYFKENTWNDRRLNIKEDCGGSYTVAARNHIKLCRQQGIEYLLFGPGCDKSTTPVFMAQSGGVNTDNYFMVSKFMNYYAKDDEMV